MIEELKNCYLCKISQTRKNVVTPTYTQPKIPGMFIADNPTSRENITGKYTDPYWKIISSMLNDFGKSLSDFYITSAIKCCPEINRYPETTEIENCKHFLIQEILFVKPKSIIFFGDSCAKNYIPGHEVLINKCFETRLCPLTIVAANPKSLREGTDKYLEFKGVLRRFIANCLN